MAVMAETGVLPVGSRDGPDRSLGESSCSVDRSKLQDLLAPVHPGEVLPEEFLTPAGLSQYRLAKEISVPPRRINEIVHGKRAVTADTALRFARYFGTTPRFWLNLQAQYELDRGSDRLGDRLEREVTAHAG